MTLLVTVFAAIICTVIWYKGNHSELKLGTLCWIYWGASLMWFIDACFEYAELQAEFFTPAPVDMLNDAYLGLPHGLRLHLFLAYHTAPMYWTPGVGRETCLPSFWRLGPAKSWAWISLPG